MSNILRLLAVFSSLIFFSTSICANQTAQHWKIEISDIILSEMAKSGTPSLQVAIGKKDEIIFSSAVGKIDVENNVLASESSRYRIGSVSKWFTSTATIALIEKGVLDPKLPIQVYCPQFPKKNWTITTNHLLTHTSGIRHYVDYDEQLQNAKNASERDQISRNRDRDLLSRYTRYVDVVAPLESFKNDHLLYEPNSSWLYSSLGYRVLACVLEGASKMSYSDLMTELIFKKAKMTKTLKDDAWQLISNRATGYRLNRDKTLRRADFRDTSENLPAGGHLSTATDLALFALTVNSGKLTLNDKMLKDKFESNIRSAVIGKESSWRNAIPSREYYGEGEMFFPDKSRLWVGHTGRISGGASIVVLQPESGLSIAVLTNAKGWNGYISLVDKIKMALESSSDLLD